MVCGVDEKARRHRSTRGDAPSSRDAARATSIDSIERYAVGKRNERRASVARGDETRAIE
jgi:hypothetical protein